MSIFASIARIPSTANTVGGALSRIFNNGSIYKGLIPYSPPVVTESLRSSVTYTAPSGVGNNIVFTFDKPYYCGQYANGDWWVRPDSPGQTVSIVSISPNKTQRGNLTWMNGYEVNPIDPLTQGYDGDITASNWSTYSTVRQPALPFSVTGTTTPISIVKVASVPAAASRPQIQFNAVLTVVDTGVSSSESKFRPPYFGTLKPTLSVSDINSTYLGTYPANGWNPSKSFTTLRDAFKHLRLQHNHNDGQWYFGAADSFPQGGYGNDRALNNIEIIGRLLADDFDYSVQAHRDCLHFSVQSFIDLAGAAAGGATWPALAGQHGGRKLPLVFCEKLFGAATSFFRTAITTHEATRKFQEDGHCYIPAGGAPTNGGDNAGALFGTIENAGDPFVSYWDVIRGIGGNKDARDPYGKIDGMVDEGTVAGTGFYMGDSYQALISPLYKYTEALVSSYSMFNSWDATDGTNAPFFLYTRRYEAIGAWAAPDNQATYDGVPGNYGITYGGSGIGTLGAGRKPSLHKTKQTSSYQLSDMEAFCSFLTTYSPFNLYFSSVTGTSFDSVVQSATGSRIGASGTITAVTGEYRVTADKAGTSIVRDWGSSTSITVLPGQYIWLKLTTGSTQLTGYSSTITISGVTSSFVATTASLFKMVDNNYSEGTGARSIATMSGLSTTSNQQRAVFAVKYKRESAAVGNLWGIDSGNYLIKQNPTNLRFYGPSGALGADFNLNATEGPESKIILLSIDTTQASAAAGYKGAYWNGTAWSDLSSFQGGPFFSNGATWPESRFSSFGVLCESSGQTGIPDGGIEWVWLLSGTSGTTIPDISNAGVKAAFESIGSDGIISGVTPDVFFASSVGAGAADGSTPNSWNATSGLTNRGSWAGSLVKSGPSYT